MPGCFCSDQQKQGKVIVHLLTKDLCFDSHSFPTGCEFWDSGYRSDIFVEHYTTSQTALAIVWPFHVIEIRNCKVFESAFKPEKTFSGYIWKSSGQKIFFFKIWLVLETFRYLGNASRMAFQFVYWQPYLLSPSSASHTSVTTNKGLNVYEYYFLIYSVIKTVKEYPTISEFLAVVKMGHTTFEARSGGTTYINTDDLDSIGVNVTSSFIWIDQGDTLNKPNYVESFNIGITSISARISLIGKLDLFRQKFVTCFEILLI